MVSSEKKPGVTGTKAGEHAFHRDRDGHLRRNNCLAGLLKYGLDIRYNQDMSDLCDGSVMYEAYRLEISEKLGTGFMFRICTECTEEEKEATGAVASK